MWQAAVDSRTRDGTGCPQCSGAKVSAQNCLASEFPYLAVQLHPTKNNGLKRTDITARSSRKVWWICKKSPDHEWQATPYGRTMSGCGCPFCGGKKVSVTNSLAQNYPGVAREFHKGKNHPLTAETVIGKSSKILWWQCSRHKAHIWQSCVYNRSILKTRCPDCRKSRD